jgi:DNA-binding transcriptional LysR family regulator
MEILIESPDAFDASVAKRTFRVASPDYLAPSFLADLARRLCIEAPHCRLEVHPMGPDFDTERALAEDKLDLVIGNWPAPPERLHLSLLLEDELVCLVRRGHPLAGKPLTEAAYLAASHLVPMRYSSVQRGVVETHLASLKLARNARVVVPYFAFAPYMVAQTDLLFTTARHFAQAFTALLPVVLLDAPPGFPTMRFYQLWHERAHQGSAHRWLRGLIAEVGRSLATERR